MTEVLHSPSHFPSSPSSSLTNDVTTTTTTLQQIQTESQTQTQSLINNPNSSFSSSSSSSSSHVDEEDDEEEEEDLKESDKEEEDQQLSLLALLITAFRKSMVACSTDITAEKLSSSMEIGWPTNVRHVAHVTFDRFNGFLGLPVEFEPEVHRRAPSASANVFGVSTESMQCSYDCRGNSVPTILLLMQRRLYSQGGLQAEGIFRINADNSQEEYVRDQLNRGVVPDGVDVHCLAGLIKAWFRELPTGVLDPLDPEKVMQCQTEEECTQLVSLLPPTESALLDWAINLMADIVQEELHNKMNARNVAMVFAPNMSQMVDPLTALMYAVQVMNFLRTLITKTLKEREDSVIEASPASQLDPSDDNGHQSPSLPFVKEGVSLDKENADHFFTTDEPLLESPSHLTEEDDSLVRSGAQSLQTFLEKAIREENETENETENENENENKSSDYDFCSEFPNQTNVLTSGLEAGIVKKPAVQANTSFQNKTGQSSNSNLPPVPRKLSGPPELPVPGTTEKARGISIVSRINSRMERAEAWR